MFAFLSNPHLRLINAVYDGTSALPPAAQKKRRPFKGNTLSAPFKQVLYLLVLIQFILVGSFQLKSNLAQRACQCGRLLIVGDVCHAGRTLYRPESC